MEKKIAVIGGGVCGLSAAYFLTKKGKKVFVFEKEEKLGGLAGGIKKEKWDWTLEKYYHHFFPSDKALLDLLKDLNLKEEIFFKNPKTSVFCEGKIYPFDTAGAILSFPLLSWQEKIKTGLVTSFLKYSPFGKGWQKTTACWWLKKYYGERVYRLIWEPLLKAKFGEMAQSVSLAWFWARIKKRSKKLGYLKGGSAVLIEKLAEEIRKNGGRIFCGTEIKKLKELKTKGDFAKILVCSSPQTFLKIASNLPQKYQEEIERLKSVGALVLLLRLKKQFLKEGTYWLNITDSSFPFVAVVEHTNFIDPKYYNGDHLLYLGGYYPQNHPFFKLSSKEIYEKFLPFLKRINPNFDFSSEVIDFSLFSDWYAQPIIPPEYSPPLLKTPVRGLFFASMHHIYPWDRGINYAIELGKYAAYEILKEE